jgi:hypothetical protein
MAKKKGARKKSANKKTSKKSTSKKKPSKADKDELLMQNFITLQKVLTNLTVRVDALTDQTSKLLSLFEISAKSFAQKQGTSYEKGDEEFLDKLDQLIEQNKLIARGITIMDDRHKKAQDEIIVPKPPIYSTTNPPQNRMQNQAPIRIPTQSPIRQLINEEQMNQMPTRPSIKDQQSKRRPLTREI